MSKLADEIRQVRAWLNEAGHVSEEIISADTIIRFAQIVQRDTEKQLAALRAAEGRRVPVGKVNPTTKEGAEDSRPSPAPAAAPQDDPAFDVQAAGAPGAAPRIPPDYWQKNKETGDKLLDAEIAAVMATEQPAPTPRTDAIDSYATASEPWHDLCRQLERELATALLFIAETGNLLCNPMYDDVRNREGLAMDCKLAAGQEMSMRYLEIKRQTDRAIKAEAELAAAKAEVTRIRKDYMLLVAKLTDEKSKLQANYQQIIREVLLCNPLSASSRPDDDQLEPPWEVIARVRKERDVLKANVVRLKRETDEMSLRAITVQVLFDAPCPEVGEVSFRWDTPKPGVRECVDADFARSLARRLKEAEQDAGRYRWLNATDNFLISIDDKCVRLKCGEPLDKWIDAAIDAAKVPHD